MKITEKIWYVECKLCANFNSVFEECNNSFIKPSCDSKGICSLFLAEVEPMGYDSSGRPSGLIVRGETAKRIRQEFDNPTPEQLEERRKLFERVKKLRLIKNANLAEKD